MSTNKECSVPGPQWVEVVAGIAVTLVMGWAIWASHREEIADELRCHKAGGDRIVEIGKGQQRCVKIINFK